jgi:glutaconyl-CoA decarboxylase
MHGETAAAASFSRRLVKEKDAGRPLQPVIDKMNAMAQAYHDNSRPAYCAKHGFVDEIADLREIRTYLKAFAGAVYQNPKSICPQHQMLLPRVIRG